MLRIFGVFQNRAKRNLAEGVGFEPTIRGVPYTRFPSVRLKPLGHPSSQRICLNAPGLTSEGQRNTGRGKAEFRISRGKIALAHPINESSRPMSTIRFRKSGWLGLPANVAGEQERFPARTYGHAVKRRKSTGSPPSRHRRPNFLRERSGAGFRERRRIGRRSVLAGLTAKPQLWLPRVREIPFDASTGNGFCFLQYFRRRVSGLSIRAARSYSRVKL